MVRSKGVINSYLLNASGSTPLWCKNVCINVLIQITKLRCKGIISKLIVYVF